MVNQCALSIRVSEGTSAQRAKSATIGCLYWQKSAYFERHMSRLQKMLHAHGICHASANSLMVVAAMGVIRFADSAHFVPWTRTWVDSFIEAPQD